MYYFSEEEGPRRRRWPYYLAGVVAVLVVASVIGFVASRNTHSNKAETVSPPATARAWSDVQYVQLQNYTLPTSASHGPAHVSAGTASGFSHDEEGGVLAAANLFARLACGNPSVYRPTIENQTVPGSITKASLLADLASGGSPSTDIGFSVIGYRITNSSTPDDVTVQLLMRLTLSGAQQGQYALGTQDVHLQWSDSDWKFVLQANNGNQVQQAPSGTVALPGQSLQITP